ncbi:hypothetical protein NsoK4_06175 [Nitrosopumilus sp. K4]|uniref:hypothetical protein n=1 Tax=Nitrosopumilus sp. K4 TaxID=2795383 RepID=UPI001BAA5902|nr:hypothetical protein [Nitrosopumilus sp. K4]QUC64032.1 hypothetical protein NsoK4_06175 [Nitrosopumilus sp. K4]
MNDELENLLAQCHDDVTTFDFEGNDVPCIIMEEKKYDDLISKVAGKPLSINTDLNILQDGLGHVFVGLVLTFSEGGIVERLLINANKHLNFFQSLAKTSMLAISSPKSNYGKENVFMIQLPRPEKAHDALDIIEKGLQDNQK